MSVITFEDGTKVTFDGKPTAQDIEEVAQQLQIKKSPAPTTTPENKSNFFANELSGNSQSTGLLGSIFQNTVGSKGVLGALQLPGLVAGQRSALGSQQALSKSQQGLAQLTANLQQQLRNEKDPARKEKLQKVVNSNLNILGAGNQQSKNLQSFVRTPAQAVGTTANAELTLGSRYIPGVSGLTNPAARIGARAGINAATGQAVGTAQGLAEGENLSESLKGGAKTAAISAILGTGFQTGREAVNAITGPRVVENLYNNAIGISKKVATSGKSPSPQLIKEGTIGTAKRIYDKEQGILNQTKQQIKESLSSSNESVSSNNVLDQVATKINEYNGNVPGEGITAIELRSVLEKSMPNTRSLLNKETWTLSEANKVRQIIDQTRTSSSFYNTQLPQRQFILKGVADELRNTVQQLAPETKNLFRRQSQAITAVNSLTNELNKPHVLRHMLALGGLFYNPIGSAVFEVAQTTAGKTATAVGLNTINKGLKRADESILKQIISNLGSQAVQRSVSSRGGNRQ